MVVGKLAETQSSAGSRCGRPIHVGGVLHAHLDARAGCADGAPRPWETFWICSTAPPPLERGLLRGRCGKSISLRRFKRDVDADTLVILRPHRGEPRDRQRRSTQGGRRATVWTAHLRAGLPSGSTSAKLQYECMPVPLARWILPCNGRMGYPRADPVPQPNALDGKYAGSPAGRKSPPA